MFLASFVKLCCDQIEVGCPRIRYPLDKRLGGSQSQFDHCGEVKNLLLLLGIEL
jgi:hypothetical protein